MKCRHPKNQRNTYWKGFCKLRDKCMKCKKQIHEWFPKWADSSIPGRRFTAHGE